MKKLTQKQICCIPLVIWIVIIPIVVKMKSFVNPLLEYPWYVREKMIADFFLYYKSILVTIVGILMLVLLCWQISKVRRKDKLLQSGTNIFIPILIYLVLAVLSSLFSDHAYFCSHGVPDQFETIWNLFAYVIAVIYCFYVVVYQNSEISIVRLMYVGAALVGLICVFQFFKVDIYRLIYSGDGYTFTFQPGTVYGPFYNTNYVGFYTLLLVPLFALFLIMYKDLKVKIVSAVALVLLIISMVGAESITAEIAFAGVVAFSVLFLLIKKAREKKAFWIAVAVLIAGGIGACVMLVPRVNAYIQASNTEKTNLENIFTYDDHVEIDYKGNALNIDMVIADSMLSFHLFDQNQNELTTECIYADGNEYYYYTISDERFSGITLTPALISEDPETYGFLVFIDDKSWAFTNEMTEDGTYYYYSDLGTLTKLTEENISADFKPLENKSSLANGRGYLWNKTIAILKNYVLFGAGVDTFIFEYPNGDFVDRYNNAYDNMFITKPHNLYLQIAVETGILSLICFLVFYLWYFISSLRIYFRQRLDNPLTITGFAIMLGTFGYMISGLANDSTITIAPLYWAMMGVGIGINYRIKSAEKHK